MIDHANIPAALEAEWNRPWKIGRLTDEGVLIESADSLRDRFGGIRSKISHDGALNIVIDNLYCNYVDEDLPDILRDSTNPPAWQLTLPYHLNLAAYERDKDHTGMVIYALQQGSLTFPVAAHLLLTLAEWSHGHADDKIVEKYIKNAHRCFLKFDQLYQHSLGKPTFLEEMRTLRNKDPEQEGNRTVLIVGNIPDHAPLLQKRLAEDFGVHAIFASFYAEACYRLDAYKNFKRTPYLILTFLEGPDNDSQDYRKHLPMLTMERVADPFHWEEFKNVPKALITRRVADGIDPCFKPEADELLIRTRLPGVSKKALREYLATDSAEERKKLPLFALFDRMMQEKQEQEQTSIPTAPVKKEAVDGSRVVLIVDDESEHAAQWKRCLRKDFGMNVEIAADYEAAVSMLEQYATLKQAPQLILLDNFLPESAQNQTMGNRGFSLFRRIRKDPEWKKAFSSVPVSFFTGDVTQDQGVVPSYRGMPVSAMPGSAINTYLRSPADKRQSMPVHAWLHRLIHKEHSVSAEYPDESFNPTPAAEWPSIMIKESYDPDWLEDAPNVRRLQKEVADREEQNRRK